jgi:hypothetical protein
LRAKRAKKIFKKPGIYKNQQTIGMHHDLPLYRTTYQFILALFVVVKGFPREYKYTIGQDLRHDSIELVRLIICANKYRNERTEYLNTLQERIELLKMQVRLCFDLRILSISSHSSLSATMENISKQITGWKQSCNNQR